MSNRPGRALRAHRKVMNRPLDASDAAHKAALAQALVETLEKFPVITADNAQAAMDFQAARLSQLMEVKS